MPFELSSCVQFLSAAIRLLLMLLYGPSYGPQFTIVAPNLPPPFSFDLRSPKLGLLYKPTAVITIRDPEMKLADGEKSKMNMARVDERIMATDVANPVVKGCKHQV